MTTPRRQPHPTDDLDPTAIAVTAVGALLAAAALSVAHLPLLALALICAAVGRHLGTRLAWLVVLVVVLVGMSILLHRNDRPTPFEPLPSRISEQTTTSPESGNQGALQL